MKLFLTISILTAALQIAPIAFSQGGGQRGGGAQRGGGGRGMEMNNLTPEEKQKVMTARRSAMQDPAVQSARTKMQSASKEMHDAMEAAMLKADPSLKPILDKMPKGQRERHTKGEAGEGGD